MIERVAIASFFLGLSACAHRVIEVHWNTEFQWLARLLQTKFGAVISSQLPARVAFKPADLNRIRPTPYLAAIDPWTPRFLEIRGRAEAIPTGGAHLGPGFGEAVIRIYPEKVNSFGIT